MMRYAKIVAILCLMAMVALPQAGVGQKSQVPPKATQVDEGQNKRKVSRVPRSSKITPEMEAETLQYVRETERALAEKLARLKEQGSERYDAWLQQAYARMRRLQRVKEEDPVRYERELQIRKLEEESKDLGRSIRKSKDESEKKQLRSDLNKLLSNLFDLRELNRQDEIDRLRAEIERLQGTLTKRQKNKATIVERRLKQLTGEADDLDW